MSIDVIPVGYSLAEPVRVVQAPADGEWGEDLSCCAKPVESVEFDKKGD